jgi:hypothetical protein
VSSPDTDYIKTNYYAADIQASSWSATMKVRFKLDDPNYQGPGSYDVKVRRYTGKSSTSYAESNTLSISLSSCTPTLTPIPTIIPSNTSSPTPTSSTTPTPTRNITPTMSSTSTPTQDESDVLSDSTNSGEKSIINEVQSSSAATPSGKIPIKIILIPLICVGLGLAILSGVLVWKKRNSVIPPAP